MDLFCKKEKTIKGLLEIIEIFQERWNNISILAVDGRCDLDTLEQVTNLNKESMETLDKLEELLKETPKNLISMDELNMFSVMMFTQFMAIRSTEVVLEMKDLERGVDFECLN